jgi:hypothetical protein
VAKTEIVGQILGTIGKIAICIIFGIRCQAYPSVSDDLGTQINNILQQATEYAGWSGIQGFWMRLLLILHEYHLMFYSNKIV